MTQVMQQHPYPIGPLSLCELEYWTRARSLRVRYFGEHIELDAYSWGSAMKSMVGIYPTFGHVDVRNRRWFKDLQQDRDQEIAIPVETFGVGWPD